MKNSFSPTIMIYGTSGTGGKTGKKNAVLILPILNWRPSESVKPKADSLAAYRSPSFVRAKVSLDFASNRTTTNSFRRDKENYS